MKKYLLNIVINLDTPEKCKQLSGIISPIVDSQTLKFQHYKNFILYHFASNTPKSEIYTYIKDVLYGVTDTFILTEITDNMTVSLNNELSAHLMDLENVTDDADININLSDIIENLNRFEDEYDDDDMDDIIFRSRNSPFKAPSLDQILDKMIAHGYNNLTEFEKDTLETYSKS